MRLDSVAQGSIVAYSIDATTGALTVIEQDSSRGITHGNSACQKTDSCWWSEPDLEHDSLGSVSIPRVEPHLREYPGRLRQSRFARMALVK